MIDDSPCDPPCPAVGRTFGLDPSASTGDCLAGSSLVRLSVVLPAYDEGSRLVATLQHIRETLDLESPSWEVIVVSDGSTDETGRTLAPILTAEPRFVFVDNRNRQGKGGAVRDGVRVARGQRVLFSDADLSTPIESLPALMRALDDGADVAIASRRLPGSELEIPQGPVRRFAGRAFSVAVQLLTGLPFQDTQCGFKLFTRSAAQRVFPELSEKGFAFDVEILCSAREQGLRVEEVAVPWRNSRDSKVSLRRDGAKMLRAIARLGSPKRFPIVFARQLRLVCLLGVALLGAAQFGALPILPLIDNSEGRYASIALKMSENGDWVTPMVQRRDSVVPFLGKPPLGVWLPAASYRWLGVNEFAARLPSYLLGLGMLWLVFVGARRLHGSTVGTVAMFVTGTSLLFISTWGSVTLDPAAATCVTGALVSFLMHSTDARRSSRGWGLALFAFLGLGMLAKGPVVVLLSVVPIAGYCAWSRQLTLLGSLPWIVGSTLATAIFLPWYVLAERSNPGFLRYFLFEEHVLRYVSSSFEDRYGNPHVKPLGTIWIMLLGGLLPWSLALLGRLRPGHWRRVAWPPRRHWFWFVLIWAITPALFFTAARAVLVTYLLPAIGGWSILIAVELVKRLQNPRTGRTLTSLVGAPSVALLWAVAVYAFVVPGMPTPARAISLVLAVALTTFVVVCHRSRLPILALGALPLAAVAATVLLYLGGSQKLAEEVSSREIMRAARASLVDSHQKVAVVGRGLHSMSFYGGEEVIFLLGPDDVRLTDGSLGDSVQVVVIRSKLQDVLQHFTQDFQLTRVVGDFAMLEPRATARFEDSKEARR